MSKPPLPPGEARTVLVHVRVKPAERVLFDEAARKAGTDLSALIRRLVLATLVEATP